ncbi:MAG: hypothetical protein Q4C46_10425 [Bacillota bacterium]|nr:hypothetical protein [Bacillota bacterium]
MDFANVKKSPVLLKAENKRFAFDHSIDMRGYIKLEKDDDKGLIVAVMDNIKFFPHGEYVYKLILAGRKKEKWHYHMVGSMSQTADGKGEGSFRINPADMDGRGNALSDFSTAIIAAMSTVNCSESLHPVLKGDFVIPRSSEKSTVSRKPAAKDYSPFYNTYLLERCIEIAKKQKQYIDVIPFKHDLAKASWKKITDCELFPMIAPGAAAPMKKYGHFLYGWRDSHYFLGIPGRFFPEEQPDGGKSGFVFWQPLLGMEEESQDKTIPVEERRKNIYGYWIAAINRYNGHIEEIPLIEE